MAARQLSSYAARVSLRLSHSASRSGDTLGQLRPACTHASLHIPGLTESGSRIAKDDWPQLSPVAAAALSLASECVASAGMWLAVPKGKISRHRRGQKQQHIKPVFHISQCGLCLRVMSTNAVVSNCRNPKCPCGPPKAAKHAADPTETKDP